VVHWRSAIVSDASGERVTTQGTTSDISSDGVSVICHRNISPNHLVTVYLLIHTGIEDNPELVFEAQGKVVNNVLSGKQGGFRLGIQFIKFIGDSKNILLKYIPKSARYGAAPSPAEPPPAKPVPAATPAPVAEEAAATEAAPPGEEAPTEDPPPATETAPVAETAPAEDAAPVAAPPQ